MTQSRRGWGLGELLAAYGWTALFAAVTVVFWRVEGADFELRTFAGRTVSTATAEGISIAARTSLFATSLVLFPLVFAVVLVAARLLRGAVAAGTFELLEPLAIAGCSLWLARAYTLPVWPLIGLVAASLSAVLVIGVLDRWVLGGGTHPERGAYLATLGIVAVGLGAVARDFEPDLVPFERLWLVEWWLGGLVVGLHVLVRLLTWRGEVARRSAAAVTALTSSAALAWLPFVSLLRDELYLSLNNRGVLGVTPDQVELALLAALAAWIVVRGVRARGAAPALEPSLFRATFPIFAFSLTAYALYRPTIGPAVDLFEPANSGLLIQQWFDFGRLPFVETFGAHGLSDSFWGFVYAVLQGRGDESWQFYEFMNAALGAVLVYVVLWRASGNGYLALFVTAFLPLRSELFPEYCELALASPLVLVWLLARPNLLRWTVFAFYVAFVFAWRLDIGFANALASAAMLAGWRATQREFRPRLRDVAIAGAVCALVCGGAFVLAARARGVEPMARLTDLAHILSSNQGFGHTSIAPEITPNVVWHLGVFPLAVMALLVLVLWRQRSAGRVQRAQAFLVVFVLWGAGYYFANFQRGLVRHDWWELGNVYVLSFGFAVACAALFFVPWRSERLGAALFLGLASVLGGSFGLAGPLPERADRFHGLWARARSRPFDVPRIEYRPTAIDRSPATQRTDERHYAAFEAFARDTLTRGQTFVDLENSPMLYVATHRRSPHYLNHLYLAHDEHLQRSELAEFARRDIPWVVAWTEEDLAQRDDVSAPRHNFGDKVHNSVRQWLFHEWLHAGYEPWRIVQRWQIWRRTNWISPAPPGGTDEREHASASGPLGPSRRVAFERVDAPLLELPADRLAYLRIDGRAKTPGPLKLRITFSGEPAPAPIVRSLAWTPGEGVRYWTLPGDDAARRVQKIELDCSSNAAFELHSLALLDATAPDFTGVVARARKWRPLNLRAIPWVWANLDPGAPSSLPVLREVWPSEKALVPGEAVQVAPRGPREYENGIHTREAAFLMVRKDAERVPRIGDRLRFAAGGERVVQRVADHEVFVSGPALDPLADGAPHEVRFVELSDAARAAHRWWFEPLRDARKPCYLALQVAARDAKAVGGVVHWGQGDQTLGRFDFELRPGVHEYLLRMSSQFNWARGGADWLSFRALEGEAAVVYARLLEGD